MKHIVAAIAWLLVVAGFSPAFAQQGCIGLTAESFVKNVPFFGARMRPIPSNNPGVLVYGHPDDARLTVAFYMRGQASAAESRSDFLQNLEARLDAEVAARRSANVVAQRGIFPYDPVAWTVSTRTQRSDGADVAGEMVIRLNSSCQLVASWQVFETAVLATRIAEITNALDAVRLLSANQIASSDFLPDRRVPAGPLSLLFGFVGPLAAAAVIFILLRAWLNYDRPGAFARIIIGAGAVVGIYSIIVQSPVFIESIPLFRHLDNLLLTATTTLLLMVASIVGSQRAALSAFVVSLCAGLSLGVSAWFNWSPVDAVAPVLSMFFAIIGFSGLLLWGMQTRPSGIRQLKTSAAK